MNTAGNENGASRYNDCEKHDFRREGQGTDIDVYTVGVRLQWVQVNRLRVSISGLTNIMGQLNM